MNASYQELVEEACRFLKENYELELEIPIRFNARLKAKLGIFRYTKDNGKCVPNQIELSINLIKYYPKEVIFDVLRHELVHYALCRLEKRFHDGDNDFENELRRLGITGTGIYEYYGEVHVYECINCKSLIERIRRLPEKSYCTCSKGPNLIYKGKQQKLYEAATRTKQ